jgi:hypothetical protein
VEAERDTCRRSFLRERRVEVGRQVDIIQRDRRAEVGKETSRCVFPERKKSETGEGDR